VKQSIDAILDTSLTSQAYISWFQSLQLQMQLVPLYILDLHVAYRAHHPGAGVIQPALWRSPSKPNVVHMARPGRAGGLIGLDWIHGSVLWTMTTLTQLYWRGFGPIRVVIRLQVCRL
jgi:hypothetical protein